MTSAPFELVVIAFPGSAFNGEIIPELKKLTDAGTVSIVDGVLAHIDENGEISIGELTDLSTDEIDLSSLADRIDGLISDEDVASLAAGLDPNSTAAILLFEHTWVKPLRDAIVASGGIIGEGVRVPGPVVDEVIAAVTESE